jgi:hypothetical protein
MWKNANHGMFAPKLNIIIPNWLKVDRAMIFLKSHSMVALKPAINVVEVAIISRVEVNIGID